jgi:hypothetical protein
MLFLGIIQWFNDYNVFIKKINRQLTALIFKHNKIKIDFCLFIFDVFFEYIKDYFKML